MNKWPRSAGSAEGDGWVVLRQSASDGEKRAVHVQPANAAKVFYEFTHQLDQASKALMIKQHLFEDVGSKCTALFKKSESRIPLESCVNIHQAVLSECHKLIHVTAHGAQSQHVHFADWQRFPPLS